MQNLFHFVSPISFTLSKMVFMYSGGEKIILWYHLNIKVEKDIYISSRNVKLSNKSTRYSILYLSTKKYMQLPFASVPWDFLYIFYFFWFFTYSKFKGVSTIISKMSFDLAACQNLKEILKIEGHTGES